MTDSERISYDLRVNGAAHHIEDAWYFESLLNVLRDRLGMTGTKYSCDTGQCGACTVTIDGAPVNSCIELAAAATDSDIRTIEDHAAGSPEPTELEAALLRGGDIQCGYCMPGIIMSASAFLAENPAPSRPQIREALSGNRCRCTGYNRIIDAVFEAAHGRQG